MEVSSFHMSSLRLPVARFFSRELQFRHFERAMAIGADVFEFADVRAGALGISSRFVSAFGAVVRMSGSDIAGPK